MSMEKVKVEDLENQMSKIMDESILVFSLKILFGSSLHFVGIRVFMVGYVRNVKNHFFCKTGHSGDLVLRVG